MVRNIICVLVLISIAIICLSTPSHGAISLRSKMRTMGREGSGYSSAASSPSSAQSADSSACHSSPSSAVGASDDSSSCPHAASAASSSCSNSKHDSSCSSSPSSAVGASDDSSCSSSPSSAVGASDDSSSCHASSSSSCSRQHDSSCSSSEPSAAVSVSSSCRDSEPSSAAEYSGSESSASEQQDCQPGTYSETGFAPCQQCPNNTYANIRETECTPCPDNMHAPRGAASLTECVCDDGYTSQWATGGPCYPVGEEPELCQRGTYSVNGSRPCQICANNTYANIGETECTPCPEHSSAPQGAASLTDCVCDDGYWSPWASGGPCYADGENATDSSTGPSQGEGEEDEGSTGEAVGPDEDADCSTYTTATDCDRQDDRCHTVRAHNCTSGSWQFISCVARESCTDLIDRSTCARHNETGERAWFADRCLPSGWSTTSGNKKCGSCCKPRHRENGDHIGGCSFINGSACALLEFQGECPSLETLNEWRVRVIDLIARVVSAQHNVSRAEATISITINTYPSTNAGTNSCAVHLQIFPPEETSLTANDFIMALYTQLSSSVDGTLDTSASDIKLSGVAAYETYGSLSTGAVKDDHDDDDDIDIGIDDDDDDFSAAHATTGVTGMVITGGIAMATMTAASML